MGNSGFKKPDNKFICYGPNVILVQEHKAETDNIKPGLLVMNGSVDGKVKVCDGVTSAPIGFAGYEQSFLGAPSVVSNRPENVDEAYATDAYVPVLGGGGFVGVGALAAGVAVKKGDLLASWSDGTVVPVANLPGGLGVKIPFVKNASEYDTGVDIPGGMIVSDVLVQVVTKVSSSTIDIGTLSTASGDADGFVDGESCASAGFVVHNNVDGTIGNITRGALLTEVQIKDANTSALYYNVPCNYVVGSSAVSVSYTTSNHDVAGNFYIICHAPGFEVVGVAEESVAVGASVQDILVRSLI